MFEDAQARIKAQIWQAIAQADLDLSAIDKATMNSLVDLVTEAALIEVDKELSTSLKTMGSTEDDENKFIKGAIPEADPNDDVEVLLWEGRPFLSLVTKYIITDERIRVIEGLVGKTRQDIELVRVQSMDQSQKVGERMLNIGDITIRSHDPNNPIIILRNVANPEEVHEILRRAVLKARDKYKLSYREEM